MQCTQNHNYVGAILNLAELTTEYDGGNTLTYTTVVLECSVDVDECNYVMGTSSS
jgi:hypothetical protein